MPVIRNLRELNRAKRAKSLEPNTYYVPRGELVLQLRDSTDSLILEKREKITISATVSWEKLMQGFTAEEDGNLTVFFLPLLVFSFGLPLRSPTTQTRTRFKQKFE